MILLKDHGEGDDHSLMFDLGLKSSQLLGLALIVGVLGFSAVVAHVSNPSDTTEIAVTSDVPDILTFDDTAADSANTAGQPVPPDAVAAGQAEDLVPGAAPGNSSDEVQGDSTTDASSGAAPDLRPTPPPQRGSSAGSTGAPQPVTPSSSAPATPDQAPGSAPSNPGRTSMTTKPVTAPQPTTATTSRPAASPAPTTTPTTVRSTTASTARPTTAAPTTAAPTTAPPATTTAPTTAATATTAAPTTQPPATSNEQVIGVLLEGESTSDSNDGWNQYPDFVSNQLGSGVTVHVDGTNGYRIDLVNNEGSKAGLLTSGTGSNVAVLWIGINDTSQGKEPSSVYTQMGAWVQNRRAEGWDHVVVLTVPKFEHGESVKSYSWGSHAIAEQKRQDLNQLIVANSAGADRIVDLRSVPGIGDAYSVYDTAYRPDKVHFSNTGNQLVADGVAAAIRSLQP